MPVISCIQVTFYAALNTFYIKDDIKSDYYQLILNQPDKEVISCYAWSHKGNHCTKKTMLIQRLY